MKPITIYTLILLGLCLAGLSYGIVPIEYYGEVRVKLYHEDLNLTQCTETFDMIPNKYYDNLDYIKVLIVESRTLGQYFIWQRGIHLNTGCDYIILQHELAHHCQYERGDWFMAGFTHSGRFNECLNEIEKATDRKFKEELIQNEMSKMQN